MEERIKKNYKVAKEFYSEKGIDVDGALARLKKFSISVQCWQGDDVGGFETPDSVLSGGGIQVTGNHLGKARSISELQSDMEKVFSLIPGNHRYNLHAIYGDFDGRKIDRDEIKPSHFNSWVDWAKKNNLKLDFNATCFSHPKAEDGYTLSNSDRGIRDFWIEHVKRAREITAYFGKELNSPSVHNLWIPDGGKDMPFDRWTPRKLLKESLDEIFKKEYPDEQIKDAVESKLFGIGSESYVVGSHDFYLGYALTRNKMICLDMGHFHLTENVSDKISSVLQFSDEVLFHISRAVRWDSDHIPILNDELLAVAKEIIRNDLDKRTNIALDFFDASLNRVGAYVLGIRSTIKSLLIALLEPMAQLDKAERSRDYLSRLAIMEESKLHPVGAIWDYYCLTNNVPTEEDWLKEAIDYEDKVLSKRV
ncbi:MAG: L-rhamnose isomerase [Ignavibacteriae bacterium]|nr:L-rhamnose isomerase [Ignavibacteriota bacterium]